MERLSEVRRRIETIEDPVTLLEGLFAYAPVGLQIYDASGRSVLTNRAFREMFGSEPPPEYNVLEDEIAAREGVLDLIHRAFAGETLKLPPVWYDPRELKRVHVEEGKRVAIDTTFFPLFDRVGAVSHVAIVFKDLTAELLAREQAEAARDEAEAERDLLRQFTAILGHDLRGPLTAISGNAALLLRKRNLPESARTGLTRIADSAARMNRMISDLLDLTRSRVGGGLPIDPQAADLREICGSVLEELRVAYPGREVRFEACGDVSGFWDPDRVAQMLSNLLGNALHYSPAESPVQVAARAHADGVSLSVTNQGPPIPAAEQATLFDPFRRGRVASKHAPASGGLGLGLFIVQQIALAHEGQVEVRSSEAEGTTFVVRLPRRPGAQTV